jgi:hypothetical protein
MILEVLRDQGDFKYPVCDIDLLADEFGTSEQKVAAVIRNFDLFEIDTNDMFFSTNLIKFLQPYLKMKEQRSIAGKASSEARKPKLIHDTNLDHISHPFQSNDRSTTVQQPFNGGEQSKVKESKGNEIKENERKEKHRYTNSEIDKLFPSSEHQTLHAEAFERVWLLYERRGSKTEAYKQWQALSPEDHAIIEEHIPRYLDSITDPRYQKHFDRYLKQRYFESEPPPKQNQFTGSI